MERPDLKQALGRLLGPTGPEVGCDECFDAARPLRRARARRARTPTPPFPGLRAHLAGCPACREEHESLRALVGGEQAL